MTRRVNLQLLLSQHEVNCVKCTRSGNCKLQKLANDYNLLGAPYQKKLRPAPVDYSSPILRFENRCVKCMRCVQVCDKMQGVHIWDLVGTGSRTTVGTASANRLSTSLCTYCGQCVTHCPVGALEERDDTDHVYRMLADPESMPMTAKRAIAEYDVLRDEYAHLFEHDPDMRVRVAMFGVHGLEPVEPPTGIDGFRTDTIYDFKDLDVLSATFAITHLYSGFNPNHHVIVRAHESYTDPPAPVIDSINNRQLRQSGGTRYLKVSRTVLDKEKQ